MSFRLLFSSILIFNAAIAQAKPVFKYRIVFPDNEEKTYAVPDGAGIITLKGTKWVCAHRIEDQEGGWWRLLLICSADKEKTSAALALPCQDTSRDGNVLHLMEGTDKRFKITLMCNP